MENIIDKNIATSEPRSSVSNILFKKEVGYDNMTYILTFNIP